MKRQARPHSFDNLDVTLRRVITTVEGRWDPFVTQDQWSSTKVKDMVPNIYKDDQSGSKYHFYAENVDEYLQKTHGKNSSDIIFSLSLKADEFYDDVIYNPATVLDLLAKWGGFLGSPLIIAIAMYANYHNQRSYEANHSGA